MEALPLRAGGEMDSVIDRYQAMVYGLALTRTGNRADADDVFQEVFLAYCQCGKTFRDEEHRKAWLLRVTANRTKSLLASPWRRRAAPLEDVYAYTDPEESAVDAAMASLPPKYRAVIHLYYFEGYTSDEIAGLLECKPSTVRSRLSRARERLGAILKEEL